MESGIRLAIPLLLALATVSCGSEPPPMGEAIKERDSMAVMVTHGVSKLISDSGYVRYKIVAEEWLVYDKTKPPRQEFPKGIFLERYDDYFRVNLYITADTAYCYNQNLWELRGRVFIKNMENGTTFSTEELFWDMGKHQLYSNKYMHIVTPDRELEGNWFVSNERMTEYHIKQTSGFMPMPKDDGPAAPAGEATDSMPRTAAPPQRPVQEEPERITTDSSQN